MADGGLSTVMAELGVAPAELPRGPLWTGEVLAARPDTVEAAHLTMLRCGAQVVLSAAYQVSRASAAATGRDPLEGDRLLVEASRRAVAARDRWVAAGSGTAWVAASIGPYGATLADGSEYRGRYGVGREALAKFHRLRLAVLVEAQRSAATRVDAWWCETIPDGLEVEVLVDELGRAVAALVERRLPAPELIMTMTVRAGGRCPTGEPIVEALAPLLNGGFAVPSAVGVNCCAPADVAASLERLSAVTSLPLAAKPNLGGRWNPERGQFAPEGSSETSRLDHWLARGARLIGGCCGTGTAELAQLARRLVEPAP